VRSKVYSTHQYTTRYSSYSSFWKDALGQTCEKRMQFRKWNPWNLNYSRIVNFSWQFHLFPTQSSLFLILLSVFWSFVFYCVRLCEMERKSKSGIRKWKWNQKKNFLFSLYLFGCEKKYLRKCISSQVKLFQLAPTSFVYARRKSLGIRPFPETRDPFFQLSRICLLVDRTRMRINVGRWGVRGERKSNWWRWWRW